VGGWGGGPREKRRRKAEGEKDKTIREGALGKKTRTETRRGGVGRKWPETEMETEETETMTVRKKN
jgi:hypothetical protein